NGGDLGEVGGTEHLDFVEAAYGDIGERAMGVVDEVDVVGDRSRIDRREHGERWTGVERHDLTHVLQREPDLLAVRGCCDVGTERAHLRYPSDDLMIRYRDHDSL